jgi:hypothetical protein
MIVLDASFLIGSTEIISTRISTRHPAIHEASHLVKDVAVDLVEDENIRKTLNRPLP